MENWPGFEYQETLTLVDVTRIRRLAQDKFIGANIRHQLAANSNLRLTKTDLLDDKELCDVKSWISLKSRQKVTKLPIHPRHYSQTLTDDVPIGREVFEQWADHQQVERIKGFVLFLDDPHTRYLFQFVEGRWQLKDLGNWPTIAKTQLVIIGRADAQVLACFLPENIPNNLPFKEGAHSY